MTVGYYELNPPALTDAEIQSRLPDITPEILPPGTNKDITPIGYRDRIRVITWTDPNSKYTVGEIITTPDPKISRNSVSLSLDKKTYEIHYQPKKFPLRRHGYAFRIARQVNSQILIEGIVIYNDGI